MRHDIKSFFQVDMDFRPNQLQWQKRYNVDTTGWEIKTNLCRTKIHHKSVLKWCFHVNTKSA